MSDDKTFEHPSYGMIGYSRVQHAGRTRLFGSAVDRHSNTIRLQISAGVRVHHLSQDWYHAEKELIEVELSAAQFAEFLTTANVGSGVPCTIRHINRQCIDDPPEELVEAEEVRTGFKDRCEILARRLDGLRRDVVTALDVPKVGKAEKERIKTAVNAIIQDVRSNLPFVLDQFQESTERILTCAKAEADAFLTHAINRAGLSALRDRARLLDGGKE